MRNRLLLAIFCAASVVAAFSVDNASSTFAQDSIDRGATHEPRRPTGSASFPNGLSFPQNFGAAFANEGGGNSLASASREKAMHDAACERIEFASKDMEALVVVETDVPSVPYSRMIFGGFLEHFHKQVYGGVFEPGSPLSDAYNDLARPFRVTPRETQLTFRKGVVDLPPHSLTMVNVREP